MEILQKFIVWLETSDGLVKEVVIKMEHESWETGMHK